MSLSSVIDIGVGLVMVYYIVSTVVSAITNQINSILEMGSRNLASGLREMLTDKATFDKFYQHSLIQGLAKKQVNLFGSITLKAPDFIPNQTFAVALFDVLIPDEKKGADEQQQLVDLRQAVADLPPGKMRDSLTAVVNNGEATMEKTRERISAWFDSTMKSVSDLYEQRVHLIVWVVAGILTLVLGIDTVNIATTLWQQPTIRAAAAAQTANLNLASTTAAQEKLNELSALRIPLFWDFQNLPTDFWGWVSKVAGLLITWIAAAQGAPFWYDVLKKVKPS